MTLEAGKSYIQKNPLFGRKLIRIDSIRESVWDWDLCDLTIVTIDKEPSIVKLKSAASSIYDHQGLIVIPEQVFFKAQSLARLYDAAQKATDIPETIAFGQEILGKIIEVLFDNNIIDESTYEPQQLKKFAEEYDNYSREQMEKVTDVIDVHK